MYGVAARTLLVAARAGRATDGCAVASDSASATSSTAARLERLTTTRGMGRCAVRASAQRHELLSELCFDQPDHRCRHGQARTEVALAREQAPACRVERGCDREVRSASETQAHARKRHRPVAQRGGALAGAVRRA